MLIVTGYYLLLFAIPMDIVAWIIQIPMTFYFPIAQSTTAGLSGKLALFFSFVDSNQQAPIVDKVEQVPSGELT